MSNRDIVPLVGSFTVFIATLLAMGGSHFNVHDANLNLATMTYSKVSNVKEVELTEIKHKSGSDTARNNTPVTYGRGAVTAGRDISSYILVGGNKIETFNTSVSNNEFSETYNKVGIYNGTFYYGHNSSNVFGVLDRLPVGTVFTIVTNGQKQDYKIAYKKVLSKAVMLDKSSVESTRRLKAIYNAGYHEDCDFSIKNGDLKCKSAHPYHISLMTCAGTNYGNGDASHRLVVEAVRV
ncbi:MAG: hypothetical protein Q4E47_01335 [Candidatus Saccharibacteria bacterium]|nr:hypothetical protein [Candidatus Saccharibacteria bacterium]